MADLKDTPPPVAHDPVGAGGARGPVASRVELISLAGIPRVMPGDDLAGCVLAGLSASGLALRDGDVLAVTSKLLSRSEGRFEDLGRVTPSPAALSLAAEVDKDAALVELILRESESVSRKRRGVLITRHRLGCVCANAGIDSSNARPPDAPPGSGPWVLLLPQAPDASARALRDALAAATGVSPAIVITDSQGRPFREGSTGIALGAAGLPALTDARGQADLDGRLLEYTLVATADQIAAAADLMAGQAAEGRPVTLLRGLSLPAEREPLGARALLRPFDQDLYA